LKTDKKSNYRLSVAFFLLFALAFTLFCVFAASLPTLLTSNAPTGAGGGMPTVVIDAGHVGEDGGALAKGGVCEKDINLKISLMLGDVFNAAGYSVVQTRTEDKLLYDRNADYKGRKKILDMAARLNTANACGARLFVSIHMNSFPQSKYRGLQVYYSPNHKGSETVAQNIQALVRSSLQPENTREVKPSGGRIYLLDKLEYPAVLVECGFLSNPDEAAQLCDDAYMQRLALVIFAAASENMNGYSSTLG
jgi:N-acetylmuramoyl-L-alanine amidase